MNGPMRNWTQSYQRTKAVLATILLVEDKTAVREAPEMDAKKSLSQTPFSEVVVALDGIGVQTSPNGDGLKQTN
jgi:hypothetical protein